MARVEAGKPLPLLPFDEIMREPLAPVEWLLEGIIAKGDRVMAFGEFGAFKSWLLLHLGLHLAAGVAWLDKFPVPVAKRVLYIDEEMHEQTLRRRIKRLGLGAGLDGQGIPFRVLSRAGVRFTPEGAKALLGALRRTDEFRPEVIIIETFRRVLSGSENDAEDVAAFWREVEPVLDDNRTLILSHHMSKPPAQGIRHARHRASGSTDILAGADSAYSLTRFASDKVRVECHKLRAAEEGTPFVVSLYDADRESPIVMRYEGAPADIRAEAAEVDRAAKLIIAFLASRQDRTARTAGIDAHLDEHGISERTGERARERLAKEGQLEPVKRGLWRLVLMEAHVAA